MDDRALWSDPGAVARPAGRHLMVLLHGAGGVPEDMTPFFDVLPPAAVGVSLAGRIAVGDRHAWADVRRADAAGFDASARALAAWVAGLDGWASVGLVGFSQGGAVAVQLLRAEPTRFAYVVTLSAFLGRARDVRDRDVAAVRPPVLCCHGDLDDVIPPGDAVRLERWLGRCARGTVRRYPDLGHTMHAAEVADAGAFARAVLDG